MKTNRHLLTPVLLLALLVAAPLGAAERTASPQLAEAPTPVASDGGPAYQVGPSDVLEVFVWKEEELSTTTTVRPDGRISLPLAGELLAAGKTPRQLQAEIEAKLGEYLDLPVVTVMVKEVNSPTISVLGEVKRPGRYLIPQGTTVLDAIAMSGGFTEFAHPGDVVVLRTTSTGTRRIAVDVRRLIKDGDDIFQLRPGDTVHVD